MVEKRFELIESGKICSDVGKQDVNCFDECRAAAYEHGYTFRDRTGRSPITQPISKSCYARDTCNQCSKPKLRVEWKQYGQFGVENMKNRTQAICRKNGKYIL